ncbi:MAG: helix-turn-helix domain-containing protein [Candidatus Woesearchaeota archaeon]|nr:helix-turn-helix domain-containing protein [Candidatus Woesearchaeota archaeon]
MTQKLKLVQTQLGKTVQLLGDQTAISLLHALTTAQRFSQLEQQLHVSTKTLSQRLKLLEEQGLITRTFYPEIPPKTVYQLTTKGKEFLSLLQGLIEWEGSWE